MGCVRIVWNDSCFSLVCRKLAPVRQISKGNMELTGNSMQTVLIADSSKNNNHYVVTSNPDVTSDGISVVHLEGANVAFCDGHVKWVKTPGPLQDPSTVSVYWSLT